MSAEELAAVDKLKVVELKARLSSYGLTTSGLKADLAARLKEHLISQASGSAADEASGDDAPSEESQESPANEENSNDPQPEPPQESQDESKDELPMEQEASQPIADSPSNDAPAEEESMSATVQQVDDESTNEEKVENVDDESMNVESAAAPNEESVSNDNAVRPDEDSVSNDKVVKPDEESTSVDNAPREDEQSLDTQDSSQQPASESQESSTNDAVEAHSPEASRDQQDESTADEPESTPREDMDDVVQKNLKILEKAEKQRPVAPKDPAGQDSLPALPEKKSNETKNQKKKRRKKTRKILKRIEKQEAGSDGESRNDSDTKDVEIEYVPDQVEKDLSWFQFTKVFDKFKFDDPNNVEETHNDTNDPFFDRLIERKKPADIGEDDEEEEVKVDSQVPKLSKKKLKQLTRMSVAELKIRVNHPELVEMHDVTTKDPVFLLTLKATRNSVPVPRHWCFKRKYLQGKRGIEKPPFDLPHFIKRTGICEMRAALQEKEEAKTLKSKQREKIRPKMGKIDIDYQKLHDAFFKWQTKPKLSMHGDLYYEGKEFETRLREKKPGDLSEELRTALGMPTGPNANKCPPPWLIAMQRYGPPPSYPNQKIPGLNAPIPDGCLFGYHTGGWGKPPVDETGKPLYGDVFGTVSTENGVAPLEQEIDKAYLFGAIEEEESEEEPESEEEEEENSEEEQEPDETGLATPAEGLATPSGFQSSVSSAPEIPDSVELRKKKIEAEMDMGDQQQQLYQVLQEKKSDRVGHAMMGSVHTYDIPNPTSTSAKKGGVELALDPSELEMDPGAMAARYEQTVREQQNQLAKEDFSDMVAEHAAKQKNKRKAREEAGSGGKKKYKEFKF